VAELNETARLLKQGMGRLVRKEGAPVKRIWFADPRVTSPNSKYSMIKKLLLPYQRVEVGAD
jgi:Rad3-related DNA helicase